ncbi:MAG: DUF2007 domain-containing protein [Planctomycetota bacterium]|nr:DUF2007 domain-containing protein [Planctomycetota bacterium]
MTRRLGRFDNEALAELARMELERHGIHAEVVGGSLNMLAGVAALSDGIQLLVQDEDYECAREVLSTTQS